MSPQPLSRADAALTLAILQNHIRWIEGEWCASDSDEFERSEAPGYVTRRWLHNLTVAAQIREQLG